jgi:hypothetical protein
MAGRDVGFHKCGRLRIDSLPQPFGRVASQKMGKNQALTRRVALRETGDLQAIRQPPG